MRIVQLLTLLSLAAPAVTATDVQPDVAAIEEDTPDITAIEEDAPGVASIEEDAPDVSVIKLKFDVYEGPTECSDEDTAKDGDYIAIHYSSYTTQTSTITSERIKIQKTSSRDGENTINFQIGDHSIMQGWDEAFIGLCKGAKATLAIPRDTDGELENPDAPEDFNEAEETHEARKEEEFIVGGLEFDVEIISISDHFDRLDLNGDGFHDREEIEAYFEEMGHPVPPEVMSQKDKDGDGLLSRHEFHGREPPSDEEDGLPLSDNNDITPDQDEL